MTRNEKVALKRTAPPEERKRQLIDATITSISRNGIAGTTLTAVTALTPTCYVWCGHRQFGPIVETFETACT